MARGGFVSSLPPAAGALRLQRLAAESTFVVTQRGRATRIDVSDSELEFLGQEHYDFRLKARCRARTFRYLVGTTIFLDVAGSLARADDETHATFRMRSGSPRAPGRCLLQVLWHGLILTIGAALGVGAFLSGDARLWQLAGAVTLAFALLYGFLGLAYTQSVRAVTTLLERALAASSESAPGATIVLQR